MATPYKLDIVTPEKHFFEGEVTALSAVTIDGEIGVLARHVPGVLAIAPSPIKFETESGWRTAAISGGFALISMEGVTVLADAIEWPEDIEVARAEEAKKRAEERLVSKMSEIDHLRAQVALQRALMRLKVANKK